MIANHIRNVFPGLCYFMQKISCLVHYRTLAEGLPFLPQDPVVGAVLQAVTAWLRHVRLFVTLGELFSSSDGTSRETGEMEVKDRKTVMWL